MGDGKRGHPGRPVKGSDLAPPSPGVQGEASVVIPMERYQALLSIEQSVHRDEDSAHQALKFAARRYPADDMPFDEWQNAVMDNTVMAMQELVPMEMNFSLHCLLRLGRIAFFAPPEWWPEEIREIDNGVV